MDPINVYTLLFAGKWVLIGLVYFILILILISVRREMVGRTARLEQPAAVAAGRLKVIQAGSDVHNLAGNILLLKPETHLGAEADNDLILTDQYISKHHACLRWDGAIWWVEDLASSNGTTVDGKVCLPHIPQPIRSGASLKIGDMFFELVA